MSAPKPQRTRRHSRLLQPTTLLTIFFSSCLFGGGGKTIYWEVPEGKAVKQSLACLVLNGTSAKHPLRLVAIDEKPFRDVRGGGGREIFLKAGTHRLSFVYKKVWTATMNLKNYGMSSAPMRRDVISKSSHDIVIEVEMAAEQCFTVEDNLIEDPEVSAWPETTPAVWTYHVCLVDKKDENFRFCETVQVETMGVVQVE